MLKKQFKITEDRHFQYIYKNGQKFKADICTLVFLANDKGFPRFGFSISKKVGKAVQRNKLKRQLKHITHNLLKSSDLAGKSIDFVIIMYALPEDFLTLEKVVNSLYYSVK